MLVSLALVGLLLATSAGVAAAARFLGRPLPRAVLAAFVLLSVLPYPSAFVRNVTPLPLDHAINTSPWFVAGTTPAHNPNLNDISTQILPWTEAVRLSWKDGALPLRDRWNGCGTPLASNGVSAAFWPLTFLTLLLPMARAFALIGSIKLLLAACGMWLWTKELGVGSRAAGFAGVTFALSFLFVPPWIFYPQSGVFCLWPWTLFLLERVRDRERRGRAVLALTAVFVLTVLAGHSESTALGFTFMALLLGGRWLMRDLPDAPTVARAIAPAALIALGLTAFLLIPSLFAIGASGRLQAAARPYWANILSLSPHGPHWTGVVTAFFPHSMGNGMRAPTLPGGTGSFSEMTMGYVGILGWSAVLLVLRSGAKRKRAEIVLWGLLLCGFGVAVGQWPFAEIIARIPGLRYVFPLRFNGWVALAAPAIAALELQRYVEDVRRRRTSPAAMVLIPAAFGIAGVALYAYFFALRRLSGGLRFQTWQLAAVLTILGLAALAALLARDRPDVFVGGLTLLCAAELLSQWSILNHVYDPALLFPDRPLLRFLHSQPGAFRVVGDRYVLFPSTNVFARLEDIRTHDAVERRDYMKFLDATCGYDQADYFKTLGKVDASALDFLNVRFVLAGPGGRAPGARWRPVYSGEDGTVFENGTVLPRAFAPERVRFVLGAPTSRLPVLDAARAFGTAFSEVTALTDWKSLAYVLAEGAEAENPAIEIADYRESTNAASFRVRVADNGRPGWVVLSLIQDGGWSAVDETGAAVPAHLANGPFLALRVPSGEHRIDLRYSPPGFRLGTILSLGTLALCVGAAALRAGRGRRIEPAS